MIILLIFIKSYFSFISHSTMKLLFCLVLLIFTLLPHKTDYQVHGLINFNSTQSQTNGSASSLGMTGQYGPNRAINCSFIIRPAIWTIVICTRTPYPKVCYYSTSISFSSYILIVYPLQTHFRDSFAQNLTPTSEMRFSTIFSRFI